MDTKLIFGTALFFLISYSSVAQPMDAHQAGLAGVSSTVINSFSAFQNPALAAFILRPVISMGAENRFLTKELQSFLFQASAPLKNSGTAGISGYRTGSLNFSVNRIGVHYARKLSGKLNAGLEIYHLQFKVNSGEYTTVNEWSGAIGLYAKPLPFLAIGATLLNPAGFQRKRNKNNLSNPTLSIGTAWSMSSKLFLHMELEEKSNGRIILATALEYNPNALLSVRTGFRTAPVQPAFGFGLNLQKMKLDAACMFHTMLGFYPCISVSREL
ncbi:MAG TPA: hypothetical protein PLU53_11745 [Bacteroidia bacterium]|nr:hypothetical protein [Bacteroidia bacterium]